jgi:molybdate transport system substrate-binding protein
MKYLFSAAVVFALMLGNSVGLRAQDEINLLAPTPMNEPLQKVIPGFEAKTGYKVKVTIDHGVDTRRRVARGDAFDVNILLSPFTEAFNSGNIVQGSETKLANLTIAVGVKKGAPKPDISTPDAVKKSLLSAKTISYVDPNLGTAGTAAVDVFNSLGIVDLIDSKIRIGATGGVPQENVVKGDAEICMVYLSDMRNPGIDVVGLVPRKVAPPTQIVAFLSTKAKDSKTAKALLDYLAGPEAEAIYKADLMEPAH